MAIKNRVQDTFEQVIETGKDMAKSSAKQIKETFNPWDIISNSFSNTDKSAENQPNQGQIKSKEGGGKGGNNTPLNFDTLQTKYADQDKKNIDAMKQRLFQLVKRDEEKTIMKGKQETAEKERAISQEDMDKKRREEEKKRQQSFAAAPQGKAERGSGKRRRQASEPQPAETKPGSSKQ